MFHWLFEGLVPVYLILLTVAVILLAVWWRTRQRRLLIAVGVVAGLAGLYALLDRLVETDYEQLVRKTNEMAASAEKRDPGALTQHIANDFHYEGMHKDDFLALAAPRVRSGDVRDVIVWDFVRGPIDRENRTAQLGFHIKVKTTWSPDAVFYRCEATFGLDADGQWRLRTFDLFDPARNERVVVKP